MFTYVHAVVNSSSKRNDGNNHFIYSFFNFWSNHVCISFLYFRFYTGGNGTYTWWVNYSHIYMTVCFCSNLWKLICLVSLLMKDKCTRKNWSAYILSKWNFSWVLTTFKLIHFRWWFIMRTTSRLIKGCTFLLISVVIIER